MLFESPRGSSIVSRRRGVLGLEGAGAPQVCLRARLVSRAHAARRLLWYPVLSGHGEPAAGSDIPGAGYWGKARRLGAARVLRRPRMIRCVRIRQRSLRRRAARSGAKERRDAPRTTPVPVPLFLPTPRPGVFDGENSAKKNLCRQQIFPSCIQLKCSGESSTTRRR
jgi:hypothetical protein